MTEKVTPLYPARPATALDFTITITSRVIYLDDEVALQRVETRSSGGTSHVEHQIIRLHG